MGPGPQAPPRAAEGRAGAESSWAKQGAGGAGARLPCSVPKAQGHGGLGPSLGAVHTLCTATDAPAHTGGLSTHHLIFRKPTTRCQGSFISFFFLTHVQILIYFWCQWWLFLREDGAGFVPSPCSSIYPGHFIPPLCLGSGGRWGASPSHPPPLVPPEISHQRPSSSPAWGLPICWGNALCWLLPLPRGLCFPPTSFQGLPGGYLEPVCLLRMDLLWNNSPLWRPRVCPGAAVGERPVG